MGSFLTLISQPLKVLMDGATEIIGKFVASPEEKLTAQTALAKLQADFQTMLVQADSNFAAMQAQVITAEAKSESWLARNWRPLLMLTFNLIIFNNYVLFPYLTAARVVEIPPQMWDLLRLGVTGYIVGRSVEKALPDAVTAYTNAKAK